MGLDYELTTIRPINLYDLGIKQYKRRVVIRCDDCGDVGYEKNEEINERAFNSSDRDNDTERGKIEVAEKGWAAFFILVRSKQTDPIKTVSLHTSSGGTWLCPYCQIRNPLWQALQRYIDKNLKNENLKNCI